MGGAVLLGCEVKDQALVINEAEATIIGHIPTDYAELGSVRVFKKMDRIEIDSHILAMRRTASIVIDTARLTTPRDHTKQYSLHVLERGSGHDFSKNQNRQTARKHLAVAFNPHLLRYAFAKNYSQKESSGGPPGSACAGSSVVQNNLFTLSRNLIECSGARR